MLHRVCASTSIALALFVAVEASAAQPQRTFVASYGNDAWPCSLPQPCRGFQAAINAVAPGGEVVALDSAGYGAIEIHKSVSVIVPAGIHAGLSPSTGIPLPGYPGQTGVVLIDIQNADIVVLRGLNINHQGSVIGGIEWISTQGGTVQIENVVINGFAEGIYMQAPLGRLFIKDSVLRNNGTSIWGAIAGGGERFEYRYGIFADHIRVENSGTAISVQGGVGARVSNSEVSSNGLGFKVLADTNDAEIFIDRSSFYGNGSLCSIASLSVGPTKVARGAFSASFIFRNGGSTRSGFITQFVSHGNNSTDISGEFDFPPDPPV